MKCFPFLHGEKRDRIRTPKWSWAHSAFSSSGETKRSDSDLTSRNISETSTGSSTGRANFSMIPLRSSNLREFTFSELKSATKNFSHSVMVGEGGFGCVYKGIIKSTEDSSKKLDVAVKQLGRRGLQGHKEWVTEVNVLGVVVHPNLVKLYGYCADDDERGIQRLLVYEYMQNGSVDDHLSPRSHIKIPWATRLRIAQDTARGLAYLHEEMDFQIIFRDFKSSNILLDEQWNAKLSDFGLARLGPGRLPAIRSSSVSPSIISDMDTEMIPGLYPLRRCKTIHLVRHAQGFHNVEGEKDYKAYLSYDLLDAQLTPLGWQQVHNLRKHVQACGLHKNIELVITSPLLRTMQTAVGAFGGEYSDGIDASPLMVANAGKSNHPAISSLNCPPFIAVELCREHLGVHPCDKRRSISEYRPLFPAIDFSLIEHEEDVLWKPDVREEDEEVAIRGMKFLNWLWTRKEKEIAIVSHSGFLYHTLSTFGKDCNPSIKSEMCTHFANCELRSLVLVDKSMIGSNTSTTDFPGKIPNGLDLPSDVAEKDQ